jgi:hypothetical protein
MSLYCCLTSKIHNMYLCILANITLILGYKLSSYIVFGLYSPPFFSINFDFLLFFNKKAGYSVLEGEKKECPIDKTNLNFLNRYMYLGEAVIRCLSLALYGVKGTKREVASLSRPKIIVTYIASTVN